MSSDNTKSTPKAFGGILNKAVVPAKGDGVALTNTAHPLSPDSLEEIEIEVAGEAQPTIAELDARVRALELGLHALGTHEGANHPGFTRFVDKFRAKYWPKPVDPA